MKRFWCTVVATMVGSAIAVALAGPAGATSKWEPSDWALGDSALVKIMVKAHEYEYDQLRQSLDLGEDRSGLIPNPITVFEGALPEGAVVDVAPGECDQGPGGPASTISYTPGLDRPFGFESLQPFIDYEATAALEDPSIKIVTAYVSVGNRLDTPIPFSLSHLILSHVRRPFSSMQEPAESFTDTVPPIWKPALPDAEIGPHEVVGGYVSWKVPWYVWPHSLGYHYLGGGGQGGLARGWSLPVFADVNAGHRFYYPIGLLRYRGIVAGSASGEFRPDEPVTVGQFAKMLVLAESPYNKAGLSYPDGFVKQARDAGLTSWGSRASTRTLTRLEAAVAVARAGKDTLPAPPAGYRPAFTDVSGIAPDLRDELALLAYNEVVRGVSETSFAPNRTCSRGQAAKMIALMLDPSFAGQEPESTTTTTTRPTTTTLRQAATTTSIPTTTTATLLGRSSIPSGDSKPSM